MGSDFNRYYDSNFDGPEEPEWAGRSPPSRGGAGGRRDGRDRDDYRGASDPYRDRRRSPGQPRLFHYNLPDRTRPYSRQPDRRRRRSRSPTNIDRYAPSDRVSRDDYYGSRSRDDRDDRDNRDAPRERRRSSPQPSSIDRYVPGMPDPTPPQLLVNPLPDPIKLEFQVGFTWFAEWWRAEQRIKEEKERQKSGRAPRVRGERETKEDREAERPKIQAAYDAYKEKLQKMQAQAFVKAHKDEDWFKERYAPEARAAFRSKLVAYRQGLFNLWQNDLENGTFDEFTLEGLYKSDAVANGTAAEREEGETTGANEVLGVGDLVPSKGGEIRDPMAALPTLLVKTIAPTVSREKMMEFAKEHLNGGEDGDVEGGFKWLSLSDPNPLKRCHRMGWIILNPETQQPNEEMADEPADRDEMKEEGEDGEAAAAEKARPKTTTENGLEKINGKTIEDPDRGNFTVHCGVHRPPEAPRKKALWDLFSAPERIARDLDLATRLVRKLDNELGEEYFGVAMIEKRVQDLADRGFLSPPEKPAVAKDHDMDVEDGEEEEGALPDEDDEMDDEDSLIMKKKLDLLVEYLRRVYNFCFFCVFESDSVHELQRKCPGGHLRRPRSSLTTAAKEVAKASADGQAFPLSTSGNKNESAVAEDGEMAIDPESPTEERKVSSGLVGGVKMSGKSVNQLQRAYKWVKTFEEKILQLVEPDSIDIQKLGGVDVSKGVEEDLQKFVKQEDTNKFRCKVPTQPANSNSGPSLDKPLSTPVTANAPELGCTKLFKGLDFWRKHVEKRHPEFYAGIINEIELVNRYVLDPAHIAPSRSDANSNGHFPTGGNVPTGTPRGFQLPNHMPMSFPMMAGQGMPMMAGMGVPGMMPMGGMPGMAGAGPIRTHGGRNNFNNRMAGPYARNDGRGNRPGGGGRGPSIPGIPGLPAGGFGGVPAFGAIGGVTGMDGSIGPSEAVAGRTMVRYDDLDAADGGKGGGSVELDY